MCGHTVSTERFTWVCIRPPHGWLSESGPKVAAHRRRAGKVVEPDRHVFVNVSTFVTPI